MWLLGYSELHSLNVLQVVVTNSCPIDSEKAKMAKSKLVILDISALLAEAIRRNHYGRLLWSRSSTKDADC